MVYTVIVNNRSYELPKKTVTVMEDLDQALKVDSNKNLILREKYAQLHEFVKRTIGEENARTCFGSDNIDEIDLSELAITVRKIHAAYDKPVTEYQMSGMKETLGKIPMDKLSAILGSAEKVRNLSGNAGIN